jgi:pimeloyl-ACP methyl ester carboxylesterase
MVIAFPPIASLASRARLPDQTGFVQRDGVSIAWDRYGVAAPAAGDPPTILLMPSWSIVHARVWKAQLPYLARSHRVVAFDGRGNGRSDRPPALEAYGTDAFVDDALAVMDATRTRRAVLVSLSMGAQWSLALAARHPERIAGAVFIAPALSLAPPDPARAASAASFDDELGSYEGWDKYNRHYWRRDYRGFLEFFFAQCINEPHSTKPVEDCVGWALETDADAAADRGRARSGQPQSTGGHGARHPLPGARDPWVGGSDRQPRPRRGIGSTDPWPAGHLRGLRPPRLCPRARSHEPLDPGVRRSGGGWRVVTCSRLPSDERALLSSQ